ncbi:hypothetical protein Z517_01959 [Fonsecaea pedrosoi CBS 271.37]|uniref:Zn(2)-C6 fungal-type domain-containing protein n=1 Tax=Fonsecaea pedrosoi CBS 271.37 TaxID=1442368 RepID=A0A0D2E8Y3_9EURO|nr:uncharacterized protein Z517_01959 [Fonsecaea pedrosoi CBS 271.37]KIW86561.1 hypothetical protein Z517_01959 [Fonsecaea pedrosoi CBS 271.37]
MVVHTSKGSVRVGGLGKRAPRACESCRSRKVRCDVTRTKIPCTNCRLDCKDCSLPTSKRRHVGDRILNPAFFEGKQHGPRSPICDAIIDFGDINGIVSEGTKYAAANGAVGHGTFNIFGLSENVASNLPAAADDCKAGDKDDTTGVEQHFEADVLADFLAAYPSPSQTILTDHQQPLLPEYITPLKKTLSAEDLNHLRRRGALDIPDSITRDLLLTTYAKWVHPFAPMLDLQAILSAVSNNGSTGTTSLLLFQAIMFAAMAYLKTNSQHGSHKQTRGIFYERARLLHDFDVEVDRLIICQAAILLSFWDGDCEGVRDSYYWIGIATLHATSIGLNFDPMNSLSDPNHRRSFKTTWWTLVMRDRLLAVALRRPVQNSVFRFDVPMLHLDDFRLDSLLVAFQKNLQVHDISLPELETLASSCVALAQLSEYIDKVLTVQYTVQRAPSAAGRSAVAVSLVPRVTSPRWLDIMTCGQELQNWYGYLPTEIQQAECHPDIEDRKENELVSVHRALLAGYYAMTLMTLYRPLLNLSCSNANETKLRCLSMKMVSQASKSITGIFTKLYADHLIPWLPDTAIAILEPAVATHLLYSMSELEQVRQISFQRFYLCWRILQQLGEVYYLAETTMSMLNAAAHRLKSLPDLRGLKSVACSQLIDVISPSGGGDDTATHIAVPFIGVVGDQKKDQSDVAVDWSDPPDTREQRRDNKQVSDTCDHNFDLEANCALDSINFDQLVYWDAVEEIPTNSSL